MTDSTTLEGRTAVITGASSGIGAATARALADRGADLALGARREERLEALADEIEDDAGVDVAVRRTDVTDEGQVDALIEAAADEFGRIDVVVANAGVGITEPVAEMSTDAYRTMMDVNVDGAFFTARAAIPHLRETEGNLIFVASFAGQYPRPGNPVYAGTKWWVRGFAKSLEGQVGGDGVAVTCVNPTEVRTEFASEDGQAFEEQFEEGEVTSAEEVAEAVAFAAAQRPPTTVSGIDVYRRDKFEHF